MVISCVDLFFVGTRLEFFGADSHGFRFGRKKKKEHHRTSYGRWAPTSGYKMDLKTLKINMEPKMEVDGR